MKEVSGTRVKALRLTCELEATTPQVVSLLLDIPATVEWMPNTKACYVIGQASASDLYYYTEVDLPWPLNNRDFVTHLRLFQQPATGIVTIDAPAVAGKLAPRKGIVRIRESKGSWTIIPKGENRVQLEYSLQVDPGGFIPASLVNYFATKASVKVIKNMQDMLRSSKYQHPRFSLLVPGH